MKHDAASKFSVRSVSIGLVSNQITEQHALDNVMVLSKLSRAGLAASNRVNFKLCTGTLPATLTSISELQRLDLSDNKLHGSLPAAYGAHRAWQQLQFMDLSNNLLSGHPYMQATMQPIDHIKLSG